MANLLQSSSNKSTCAPSYYTNYLSTLANKGLAAQCAAQYVGAQPLQNQAFCTAASEAGNYNGNFQTGAGLIGCAANQNIAGSATPYLQAATTASPLCAAKPLICETANMSLGQVAQCYMSPYLNNQVQNVSNIGMRNIQQNLAPQATAATVGSGQFGSQRGAQVLGQVENNAMTCLNNTIANMENAGYTTAMCAAKAKESALGALANTTSAAQEAQNQVQLGAGTEAATSATQQANALQQAGLGMGTLGTEGTNAKLACINALATLGGQQQTIAQNKQCYPLTTLSKAAGILSGANVPMSTKQTLCMSPLSAIGAAGSAALGLLTPCKTTGKTLLSSLKCGISTTFGGCEAAKAAAAKAAAAKTACEASANAKQLAADKAAAGTCSSCSSCYACNSCSSCYAGCSSLAGCFCCAGCFAAKGGLITAKALGGTVGCASTIYFGGLPFRRK